MARLRRLGSMVTKQWAKEFDGKASACTRESDERGPVTDGSSELRDLMPEEIGWRLGSSKQNVSSWSACEEPPDVDDVAGARLTVG